MLIPENIQDRVYQYLDPLSVETDFIRSNKVFNLISKEQEATLKMMYFEKPVMKSGLFNSYEYKSQINYFIDRMQMNVYLP